jgi:hypothetical protein
VKTELPNSDIYASPYLHLKECTGSLSEEMDCDAKEKFRENEAKIKVGKKHHDMSILLLIPIQKQKNIWGFVHSPPP